jgi:DNA-binding transcriptional ArsR family regulator
VPARKSERETSTVSTQDTVTEHRYKIQDPQVMRALAHPARLAIMEHLAAGKTATATEFAEVCGLSPSATSYHLRALAKIGLVEEAPSRGDARERVWRTPHHGLRLDPPRDASQDVKDAERELISVYLAHDDARVRRYVDNIHNEPSDWYEAAQLSTAIVAITVDELLKLNTAIQKLIEPYTVRRRADPPTGARRTVVICRSFPVEPPPTSGA